MLTRIETINKVWRLRQNQAFKMIRIHQIKQHQSYCTGTPIVGCVISIFGKANFMKCFAIFLLTI